ncbi:DUF3108 domain-containing protein [Prevotella dentasini]|uniref:DUF3108 domain-containing protein n=1 Tax=Prevotella dentasini TaxID=589537 RepID=UPI0004691D27|nr:DUF3108 domain-containing protein [Prevotella dentasini]
MRHFKIYLIALLTFFSIGMAAQCTFRNTAFGSGEYLTYNLYYNWKFIWVKAGTASWYTISSTYRGIPAYRASLTTRGNGKLDDYFVLRDTLLCYDSKQMAPLYFRKGAREGKRYTVDEVFYSYPNGKCHVRQHRIDNDGKHQWQEHTYEDCVYDMMSIFLRARSFNPESWKKGQVVNFPIVDGNSKNPARIVYNGKTNIKADNGCRYRCLELSYLEYEKGKWRNVASFYVTDDQNHIPIRLDMRLKFGSAKAYLVSMKGISNKITSQLK